MGGKEIAVGFMEEVTSKLGFEEKQHLEQKKLMPSFYFILPLRYYLRNLA